MFVTATGANKIGTHFSPMDRTDALACIPVKNVTVKSTRLESGEVVLAHPVGMRPWMMRIMRTFGGSPDYVRTKKLQLDTLGTSVWDLIDGHSNVKKLIKHFATQHKLHPREAEVSISKFLRELGRRGIIGLK